jgi:hypothetical protein
MHHDELYDTISMREQELEEAEERIAELEADQRRLEWLLLFMLDLQIDEMVCDLHELALNIAVSQGLGEPTESNYLEAYRMAIDEAMKQGGE